MEPNCTCPVGTYIDSQFVCKACSAGCEICSNTTKCDSCDDTFYLKNKKCIPCKSPCETCVSETACRTCNMAIAKAPK